jgi:TRAP-type C4-dicarboxylate transport system substrate-binding protein
MIFFKDFIQGGLNVLKKWRLLFYLILTAYFLCSSASASEPFLIKFATVAPEGSTWMKYIHNLDQVIREKSQGTLGFKFYAGGVMGDELDVLKKIRIGQIHAAAFSGVGLGSILPMVRVLDLPFLFRNDQEIDLVQEDLQNYFGEQFRPKGFEMLSWAEVGDVHIFSKKPIQSLQDLHQMKVWTWAGDPIAKETFSAMGVTPIPLAVTDVTTSLNTGMIDTVYAPPLGAIALQWNRSLNFMTALPLTHSTGALLISESVFNKIPAPLASLLKEECLRAMQELTLELRKQSKDSIQLLEKSGIKIIQVPQNNLNEFYQVHQQVAHKLTGQLYPKELLDQIYALLKR